MEFIIRILEDLLDGCTPEHMRVCMLPDILFWIDNYYACRSGGIVMTSQEVKCILEKF